MTLPLWGSLEKDQDDPTTIEERIAEMIVEHEEDPEAHLGAGESLEQHKANEVIDHPPFSVVRDKIFFDRNQIDFYFTSSEPFIRSSTNAFVNGLNEFDLVPGPTINDIEYAYLKAGDYGSDITSSAKNPYWEISILLASLTSQEGWILQGKKDFLAGFGFKIVDDDIYGFYYDTDLDIHTELLTSLSAEIWYKLGCELVDGVSLKFFINDVELYDFGAVSPGSGDRYLELIFKTTSAALRALRVKEYHWDADK